MIDAYDPAERGLPTVGSSDVAVIMGIAPWRDASPMHTWAELSGLIPYRSREPTSAMTIGTRLESTVLGLYGDHTGALVIPNGDRRYTGAYPWMHSTPDGAAVPAEDVAFADEQWGAGEWGVDNIRDPINVEAKVVIRDDVWYPEEPSHYTMQAMWHNMCAHRSVCHIAAFFLRPYEFRVFTVGRDFDLEDRLRRRVWAWYERHVLGGLPPEPDDSRVAAQTLAAVHRGLLKDQATVAGLEDIRIVERIRDIRERLAELNAEKDRLTNILRLRTQQQDAKTLVHPAGDKLARWSRNGAFTVTKARS